jgi:hypothetical protein
VVPDSEASVAEHAVQSNYGIGRKIYTLFSGTVDSVYVEVTPA